MKATTKRNLIVGGIVGSVVLILIIVLSVVLTLPRPAPSPAPAPVQLPYYNYRLSNTTVPTWYELTMRPYIDRSTWEGSVKIHLKISSESQMLTNYIWLHQFNLTITNAALTFANGTNVNITKSFSYSPNEYWVVQLTEGIPPGQYILSMAFTGSFSGAIVGFYPSKYKDGQVEKYLVTTKFEPTYARRAFPCFDEPNKKANFSITLIHEKAGQPVALSNMPVQTQKKIDEIWIQTSFQTTVQMSTYLVCFIAADFGSITKTASNGIPITTWGPKSRLNQTEYALSVAATILPSYDAYFGIPYKQSFPKLDLVSIPDFISGAMENWGIVTFRETNILYTEGLSSTATKQRVAQVVAHELAHMWFGNLVTMDWWNDLWLNEGFATFIAYVHGMPKVAPLWNSDTNFVYDELQYVMVMDAALSSHPIIQNVNKPDDINAAFDTITYSKGSSVLRMLEDYLSPSVFQKGISTYLKQYSYQNAKTDDLWAVLTQTANLSVKALMDSWTQQKAFPVVTFSSDSKTVTQTRFFINPEDKKTGERISWQIPIKYYYNDQSTTSHTYLLSDAKGTLDAVSPSGWTKLNRKEKGYYRVNYDESTWALLKKQLFNDYAKIFSQDRSELLDDCFSLAGSDLLDYSWPLSLLPYLKNETNWVPWASAGGKLSYIKKMLRDATTPSAKLKQYINSYSGPVLDSFGWNDIGLLRVSLIGSACGAGNMNCLNNATSRFQNWIKDPTFSIPANYRSAVFNYGIANASEAEWNITWSRYLNAPVAESRVYQNALAQINNKAILQRYLNYASNTTYVRTQDYFSVLQYISRNPAGTDLVWKYVTTNWQTLVNRFTLNDRYFGRSLARITESFNTAGKLQEVEDFFRANPKAGAGKGPRSQALATIRNNLGWMNRNQQPISAWLTKNVK